MKFKIFSGKSTEGVNESDKTTDNQSNGLFTTLTVADYSFPTNSGTAGYVLSTNGPNQPLTWIAVGGGGGGSGTVTSVSATVPNFMTVTGSPITTSGTLAFSYSGVALPTLNGGTGLTTVGPNGTILQSNGTTLSYVTPPATGVTSVGISVPSFLSVSNTPITTSGTIAITGTSTGTGSVVLNTSPTLVTPTLGAASATSLTLSTPLSLANGGTGSTVAGPVGTIPVSNGSSLYYTPAGGISGTSTSSFSLQSTTIPLYGTTIKSLNCSIVNSGLSLIAAVTGGQTAGTLQLFNVSNPLAPVYLSSTSLLGSYRVIPGPWPYFYVPSSGGNTLFVINASNPYSPTIQTQVNATVGTGVSNALYSGVYSSGYVYLATQAWGLVVVNVTTTPPTVVFTEGTTVNNMKTFGSYLDSRGNLYITYYANNGASYTTTGWVVKTWNITTPSSPTSTTFTAPNSAPYNNNQPIQISGSGNTLFLTAGSYIFLIDATTPTSLSILTSIAYSYTFSTGLSAQPSYNGSNYIYIPFNGNATNQARLDLYDITNKTAPVLRSSVYNGNVNDPFGNITVFEGYVYVGDYGPPVPAAGQSSGLQIFSCASESTFTVNTSTNFLNVTSSSGMIGTTILVNGFKNVSVPAVTSTSRVFLQCISANNLGNLQSQVTAGSGFAITSTSSTDNSIIAYFIVNQI